jgi:hypothetical protein
LKCFIQKHGKFYQFNLKAKNMSNNLPSMLKIPGEFSKVMKGAIVFTLLYLFIQNVMAQNSEPPKLIGTVSDLYNDLVPPANARIGARKITDDDFIKDLSLNVNTALHQNGRLLVGEVKGKKNSQVYFAFQNGKVEGKAIFYKEKLAYNYYSDENANVWKTTVDINEVICVDFEAGMQSVTAAAPSAGSPVYNMQSFPGASAVVMLDFDGHHVANTIWNFGANAQPFDALPSTMTESEIIECFQIMSEDYRPFNINITTNEAIYQAAPVNKRMRCIFTPTTNVAPGTGGYANIGSFHLGGDYAPCWAYNGGGKASGETGSHEVGHTLGLYHDGREIPGDGHEEYFEGHGDWAPIMGVSFYKPIGQWSKGEYLYANNTSQDDIAIIAANDGVGFRTDDYANFRGGSQQLMVNSGGFIIQKSGIIEKASDVDVFFLNIQTGFVSINVNPVPTHPNLDVLIKITNAEGGIIAITDPTGLPASFNAESLPAGTYYVHVEGTGAGNPSTDGYSDYSSLGAYTISGSVQNPSTNQVPVVSISSPANGASFARGSNVTVTAQATDPDGSIQSVRLFLNGVLMLDDFIPPYTTTLSNMITPGIYELTAVAVDNQGAQGVSTISTFTIINKVPVVTITSPVANTLFTKGSTINITAQATDPDGQVANIKFYNGDQLLGQDNSAPYTFAISNVQEGNYFLTAVALDNEGGTGISAVVKVSVPGLAGPSCVLIGQSYLFEVVPDPTNPLHISWWVNGDAGISIDPSDSRKATVIFNPYNNTPVTIFAGVNYNQAPYYKEYSKTVQFGGCSARSSAIPLSSLSSTDLTMYPNPAQEEVVFSVNGSPLENSQITIMNNTGAVVLKSEKSTVDVSGLTSGLYQVLILSEGAFYSEKLVIK